MHPKFKTLDDLLAYTKTNKNGCMEWLGTRIYGSGYATFNGIPRRVSRLVVHLSGREIPKGMEVCHRCDNLRIVTHKSSGVAGLLPNKACSRLIEGWRKSAIKRVRKSKVIRPA